LIKNIEYLRYISSSYPDKIHRFALIFNILHQSELEKLRRIHVITEISTASGNQTAT